MPVKIYQTGLAAISLLLMHACTSNRELPTPTPHPLYYPDSSFMKMSSFASQSQVDLGVRALARIAN